MNGAKPSSSEIRTGFMWFGAARRLTHNVDDSKPARKLVDAKEIKQVTVSHWG